MAKVSSFIELEIYDGVLKLPSMIRALLKKQIGTVLSYVGAITGLVVIFLLPVLVHIAQSRAQVALNGRQHLLL